MERGYILELNLGSPSSSKLICSGPSIKILNFSPSQIPYLSIGVAVFHRIRWDQILGVLSATTLACPISIVLNKYESLFHPGAGQGDEKEGPNIGSESVHLLGPRMLPSTLLSPLLLPRAEGLFCFPPSTSSLWPSPLQPPKISLMEATFPHLASLPPTETNGLDARR